MYLGIFNVHIHPLLDKIRWLQKSITNYVYHTFVVHPSKWKDFAYLEFLEFAES